MLLDACPTTTCMTLSTFFVFIFFVFVSFVDLILYCAVFCFNILALAETHKKHVPIFNLCGVLCFPHLGLIMVTCLVKKKTEHIGGGPTLTLQGLGDRLYG